jgi:hypothetical protein
MQKTRFAFRLKGSVRRAADNATRGARYTAQKATLRAVGGIPPLVEVLKIGMLPPAAWVERYKNTGTKTAHRTLRP